MARLGAEMRQVDQGHRISGADAQHCARRQRKQPFAGPQDGQGAEKPFAIHHVIPVGHAGGVAARAGMGKVTGRPRGCDALSG